MTETQPPLVDQQARALDLPLPAGTSCQACGSPVDERDRFCPACGSTRDNMVAPNLATGNGIQELPEIPPAESPLETASHQKHFRCQNCSAEINIDPGQRSYVCPFCESTYVIELTDHSQRQRPEFVLGFGITPAAAWEKFQQWLRSKTWFHPLDLQKIDLPDRLRGVYLPFWSFSMLAVADWEAMIGEYWYRTETYTTTVNGKTETHTRQVQETEWWPLAGNFHHYYYGYLISGSKGLAQNYADAIQPYHLQGIKRFEPYFLAGWLSEEYSLERDEAERICRGVFQKATIRDIDAFLPGDTHRDLQSRVEFQNVSSDLILLPIYLLTYQYKNRTYHFVMNGQTGKIHGERPFSWIRLGLYALAAILLGLIIGVGLQAFT
ncbi:MAG: zinc ribbon domain-containing protein [Pirellulales bacterium]|nr:zinc ribbon domain-containing protein [Pirellulales bacterium]